MTKTWKKDAALLLCVLIIATSMACGQEEPPQTPPAPQAETTQGPPPQTPVPTTEPTEENAPAPATQTAAAQEAIDPAATPRRTKIKPDKPAAEPMPISEPTQKPPSTETHPFEDRARAAAAGYLGLNETETENLTLESWEEYTWSNGAMGCPHEGRVYTEARVEGVVVRFSHRDQTVTVHMNQRNGRSFVPTNCLRGATPGDR